MANKTALFTDERCFWHAGGNYAFTQPLGGLVQPLASGGLPEDPETKRRLWNLLRVTGLVDELAVQSAPVASRQELERVHPASYLDSFKDMSDSGGGEIGLRTPFGQGGYEIAALSAGLAIGALRSVLTGTHKNAYALCRPPGHHCLPDFPNGFCLLANLAIAIKAARTEGLAKRFVVIDWDVHHGNGTEAIFLGDPDVLTISVHQERNYPLDTGAFEGLRDANLNIPLPPGTGHVGFLEAFDRLVAPAVRGHQPDVIVVACGYDASAIDPLSRTLATADTFQMLTRRTLDLAAELCDDRVMMAHEGGYSEVHVPFCGHGVLQEMAGSTTSAPDPFAETLAKRQPSPAFDAFVSGLITQMAEALS